MSLQITETDLEKAAEEFGRKLGFYIMSAPWTDEVKQAWTTLIPEMTIEELDELLNTLEVLFANAATQDIDRDFEKQTAQLQSAHSALQTHQSVQLDGLIKKIEQRLRS